MTTPKFLRKVDYLFLLNVIISFGQILRTTAECINSNEEKSIFSTLEIIRNHCRDGSCVQFPKKLSYDHRKHPPLELVMTGDKQFCREFRTIFAEVLIKSIEDNSHIGVIDALVNCNGKCDHQNIKELNINDLEIVCKMSYIILSLPKSEVSSLKLTRNNKIDRLKLQCSFYMINETLILDLIKDQDTKNRASIACQKACNRHYLSRFTALIFLGCILLLLSIIIATYIIWHYYKRKNNYIIAMNE